MFRRNFLQMLGIGGVASTLPVTLPLFGSPDRPQGRGETVSLLTGGHLVLVRPPTQPSAFGFNRMGTPAIAVAGRWPLSRGAVFQDQITGRQKGGWTPLPVLDEERVVVHVRPSEETQDPHLVFYEAAMKMRERFKTTSLELLTSFPKGYKSQGGVRLVTVVDNPIFAGAAATREDERASGFTLEADFTQYLVADQYSSDLGEWVPQEINPNGWEVYSEFGEFPIEIPSKIDMDQLLAIDHTRMGDRRHV